MILFLSAFWLGYQIHARRKPQLVQLQNGIRFHRSREELETLKDFLSQAKQEVFIAGTTLHSVVGSNRPLVRDLVRKGITVRLLFLDPASEFPDALSDCLVGEADYSKAIIGSLQTACKIKRELAEALNSAVK